MEELTLKKFEEAAEKVKEATLPTNLIFSEYFSNQTGNKVTVDGQQVESYQADVDTDANYTPDTEVVENGAFQESKFRSAPYFDLRIDGITLLDEAYG